MKPPRRRPLPWQSAKSAADDPLAPQRIAAILRSPSYSPGDSDAEFLQRGDTRGQRLELDYLKPELLLQAAGMPFIAKPATATALRTAMIHRHEHQDVFDQAFALFWRDPFSADGVISDLPSANGSVFGVSATIFTSAWPARYSPEPSVISSVSHSTGR